MKIWLIQDFFDLEKFQIWSMYQIKYNLFKMSIWVKWHNGWKISWNKIVYIILALVIDLLIAHYQPLFDETIYAVFENTQSSVKKKFIILKS